MRHLLPKAATIRGFSCALALTVSAITLTGCVTAAKDTASSKDAAEDVVPVLASVDAPAPAGYADQQVAAAAANGQQQPGAAQTAATAMVPVAGDGQPASLTMQSTGLNATSSSIFAVQNPNAAAAQGQPAQGQVPLPAGQKAGVNPATNSLFNSGQPAQTPLPLEGASNSEGAAAAQQVASAGIAADGTPLPVAVPIPTSSDSMRTGAIAQPAALQTASPQTAERQTASADDAKAAAGIGADSRTMPDDTDEPDEPDAAGKSLTFASLFAAKRKNRSPFDGDRFAKAPEKKTLTTAHMKPQQIAALGFTDLPGVRTTSMFATVEDSEPAHDDDSAQVQVASLSGLARLAPSGLMLQTEKVETGCFQPDLLRLLKVVETHYGRKVMVTSGLRDLKHNAKAGGSKHSLHTTCQAADIQVPGVGKWDLAEYLRTIPGRGGVGTYCHTESVHIDTGESRDWNWRCRRRRI